MAKRRGSRKTNKGEPFVGKAGQLLDNILLACGLDRNNDVYIANVLKCLSLRATATPAGMKLPAAKIIWHSKFSISSRP
nr:uracil-DNA glycosylase family protein [Paludibacterium denitrificans]